MPTVVSSSSGLFAGGGQMGELMRSIDWSKTPVGAVEGWPQSLKTALSVLLQQRTAVFIFWGPEHVQFYNDAYRPILGTSKHPAAMGQAGRECWPEIWDIIEPLLDAVYRGESTAVEDGLLVMDRTGYLEEGYYTYTYSPITDESGTVGGVFCIVYDTTARVIGERRLRTLRDLASRAIARDAETACRIAAGTLAANPYDVPFAAVYLHDSDFKCARLVGAAGIEPGSAAAPRAISLEQENSVLAALARKNHSEVLISFASQVGPLPSGPWPVGADAAILLPIVLPGQSRPAGFIIAGINPRKQLDASYRTFFELVASQIATAVAESRAYEEERKRAEALAELDRVKTAFFSNVSHEFRTPLTLLLGPLADMLARSDFPAAYRDELALVYRNGLRLLKLVNTLLDFSRIEAGRIQACYEPTDVAALTTDHASIFRSAIERAGLRLTIDCQSLGEPVYLDREMWEKIVLNLLSNAFKFTFEGEIRVALAKRDSMFELLVRDTGIGIGETELAHVFDRFHRVEGVRARSQEGSGIGLALVQELAKLHGGNVRVESALGKGSVFIVSIPLGWSHLPAQRLGKPRSQPSTSVGAQPFVEEALRWLPDVPQANAVLELPSEQGRLGVTTTAPASAARARILVADDNADMRDYLRRLLGESYDVRSVSDGVAALASIQETSPDIVVADVMMPRLDGFGLLRRIRMEPKTAALPVILLSARAGEEARVEGLQAGADDYLVKPFSARELLARVASRLEITRLRQQSSQLEHRLRTEAEAERQRLRDLIAQAPALIAVLRGSQHVFELVNEQYLAATGRSEAELTGRPLREALPEIANQEFPRLLDEVYGTGRPFVGSEALARLDRRRDGRLEDCYFNFVYQPSRDAAGNVEGVIIHAVDVTAQVIARRRIEENERQLRTLADSIPQLAWMAEPDGYRFWYNQRWYEYTGTTLDQMRGWGWQSAHDPRFLPAVLERWRESLRTGSPFEMEFPLRGAQGEFRWFLTRVTPLRDSGGNVVRWFGTNTDVTELKRIQDERTALLHREQEARATAELLNRVGPTLLSELELGKLIQSMIDLATALTGAEIGVFLHEAINDSGEPHLIHAVSGTPRPERDLSPSDIRILKGMSRNQAIVRSDDLLAGEQNGRLPFQEILDARGVRSLLAAAVRSRSGEVLGGLLFGHSAPASFTNRHEALIAGIAAQAAIAIENAYLFEQAQRIQKVLQRSNEELQRANKDLQTFAYSASHDLQEPLRNIAISAQLLEHDHGHRFNASATQLLSCIIEGAIRMETLVRDLLAYTRATQTVDRMIAPVDANAVLKNVLESMKTTIEESGAMITSDALPVLTMNDIHLSLLFQNLIGNAIKYRREEAPRIQISAARDGGSWVLSVADNGIGIAPQYRQQVFGLFKRLHSRSKYSGSGVGLAICQRVIEQYGGRIWVDGAPDGSGSIFSFEIRDSTLNP